MQPDPQKAARTYAHATKEEKGPAERKKQTNKERKRGYKDPRVQGSKEQGYNGRRDARGI